MKRIDELEQLVTVANNSLAAAGSRVRVKLEWSYSKPRVEECGTDGKPVGRWLSSRGTRGEVYTWLLGFIDGVEACSKR